MLDGERVTGFSEKPRAEQWVNGGFMVFERGALAYLSADSVLEREPLERLAADGALAAYRHEGYWRCLDTYKDAVVLEEESDSAPWLPRVAGVGSRVEFRVLGPLEVVHSADPSAPPGVKERTILARLLLEPARVVPTDALIEAAWPETDPETAARSLAVRLANLRAFLEPDRAPGAPSTLLIRDGSGYRLAADLDQIDAVRLERLVTEAAVTAARDGARRLRAGARPVARLAVRRRRLRRLRAGRDPAPGGAAGPCRRGARAGAGRARPARRGAARAAAAGRRRAAEGGARARPRAGAVPRRTAGRGARRDCGRWAPASPSSGSSPAPPPASSSAASSSTSPAWPASAAPRRAACPPAPAASSAARSSWRAPRRCCATAGCSPSPASAAPARRGWRWRSPTGSASRTARGGASSARSAPTPTWPARSPTRSPSKAGSSSSRRAPGCCCSTTASTCSTAAPPWSRRCSPAAPTCASSSRVARRWASTASR